MSRKRNPNLFSTNDFYGNLVTLAQTSWDEHILVEHPELAGYEDLIKSTLKNPSEVRLSTQSDTALAFISEPGTGPRPEGIRTLVDYADMFYEKGSSSGMVVTAYPIDIVKYGTPQLGKTIYKKGRK
jgi:hypothetical protein